MKHCLAIFVLSLLAIFMYAPQTYAQGAIPAGPSLSIPGEKSALKDLANQFYNRCHENPDPTLTTEQQEEYCTCLSAQIYRTKLTQSEREYLATGIGEKMTYERSVAEVYGQCIGIPGRVATYKKCSLSPKAYKWVKGEKELDMMCTCVVDEMDFYWSEIAPSFLEVEMIYRRDITDPLAHVMSNRDFPVMYGRKRSKCTGIYGRRD